LRRYTLIHQDKLAAYKEAKQFAKEHRVCALCRTTLLDLRRIYCSAEHRRKFWQKYEFFIAWRQIRSKALRRDRWLCVSCRNRGKFVRAKEVHHIIEIRDGGDEFDLTNTESLCRRCHLSKTRKNQILRIERMKHLG
jgi:hypothetical protein